MLLWLFDLLCAPHAETIRKLQTVTVDVYFFARSLNDADEATYHRTGLFLVSLQDRDPESSFEFPV